MAQLLNDLLFLARQDQGVKEGASAQAGWRRFDLTELIDDVILQCQAQNQADGRGVRLRVEVRDGGPGIAPLEQSLVFERFWRGQSSPSLEESHSGLGLPIARAIARRHGGELSLASGEPGACCFLVDLPAA